MSKLPIGLVLRQIFDEKTISATDLVRELGISKAAVYNNFKRTDMTNQEIIKWARVLGVTKEEIVSRWKEGGALQDAKTDSNYLQKHLENLELQFRELNEQMKAQLAVKDRQIEKLMDLLGKFEAAPVTSEGKFLWDAKLVA